MLARPARLESRHRCQIASVRSPCYFAGDRLRGAVLDDRLLQRHRFYVGGEWVKPAKPEFFDVVSPSSEEVVGQVPNATPADIDRAVEAARVAFDDGPWPRMSPEERSEVLARAADHLRQRTSDIAEVTTEEMGCAISQAPAAQTGLVAPVFDFYATLIRTFEFERQVVTGERASLVTLEPVGVVAAIIPWNAPVTLAAWKTAPSLAAGCTVVIKPPPEAPLEQFHPGRGPRGGRRPSRRRQRRASGP